MRTPPSARRAVTAGTLLVVTAGTIAAGATVALSSSSPPAPSPYDRYTLSQNNVSVAGAPGATASPRAGIVVPRAWKRLSRERDRVTFRSSSTACPFTVRLRVRVVAGPDGTAADHVALAVPAASSRNVQDEGTRGPGAWRVVRLASTTTRNGIDARHAYATAGATGMPEGRRAWVEVVVTARADVADECHAGHFRTVSRQIGDALAVNVR
jgi:hypothetical protein